MYGSLHSHTNPVPNSNKMNKIYKPEEWAANKLIHQNIIQMNDILFQWSNFSNNFYEFPFKTGNSYK